MTKLSAIPFVLLTFVAVACSGSDGGQGPGDPTNGDGDGDTTSGGTTGDNPSLSGGTSGGGTSSGGTSSGGTSSGGSGPGGDLSSAIVAAQQCGILGSGLTRVLPSAPYFDCVARCAARKDCAGLTNFFCDDAPEVPGGCFDECETESHVCGNGIRFLHGVYACDGEPDCEDGSDEAGCDYFWCNNAEEFMSYAWVCDGESDCSDGSDETGCAPVDCP